jgi:hypothetical protein
MILILLIIVMIAGMAIFLMNFASTISQDEYMNLYAHNMLLSLMRSDTGYTEPDCKLVSDSISCAFFNANKPCGDSACIDIANRSLSNHISTFSTVKKSYRYLLVVEPQGFRAEHEGEPFTLMIGDESLLGSRGTKFAANEQIRTTTSTGVFNLNAKLIIATK